MQSVGHKGASAASKRQCTKGISASSPCSNVEGKEKLQMSSTVATKLFLKYMQLKSDWLADLI